MNGNNIRLVLDSSGKSVLIPIIQPKRGALISFLKYVYLKDLGLSNKQLNDYFDNADNIILIKK